MAKKILIVEDDAFLRDLAAGKLSKDGYDIKTASDVGEINAMFEAYVPDAILLDLVLPGTDGYGILKKVRENLKMLKTPVIVFSNLAEEKDIKKAKDLGANEFMIKSNFTLDEVSAKIASLLRS
jgi:DNA-binding response OmpR family regulator